MKKRALIYAAIFLAVSGMALIKTEISLALKSVMPPMVQQKLPPVLSTTTEYFLVKRVVDGDTIELLNGKTVRYIGVDAPESVHPKKSVQCFGKEAARRNADLVLNKKVRLVKDVSETDRYKRLLRYVYLADGTLINKKLVEEGYAYAATFPPDVAKNDEFRAVMTQARENKKGLWSTCRK